jgi:hypothetical protein
MLDIKNITYGESNLFQASLTPISNLNSGIFPIIINPFGEAYPELGNTEGVGFKTILSYIRDGGIFVNSGGQPFFYSWDVLTGNYKLLVNFIPALTSIQSIFDVDGNPALLINESLRIPIKSLPLKRHFNVDTEWDRQDRNITGPQEMDIEFDRLPDDSKLKTKAKVYRPVKEMSNIIPLAHSYNDSIWGIVYPIVAIKFGRGFLIHTGMSLDEEREYKILLDLIRRISLKGYETLAKPCDRISGGYKI